MYVKVYRRFLFEIFDHKMQMIFVAPLLGNRGCHGIHFVPTRLGRPHVSFKVGT